MIILRQRYFSDRIEDDYIYQKEFAKNEKDSSKERSSKADSALLAGSGILGAAGAGSLISARKNRKAAEDVAKALEKADEKVAKKLGLVFDRNYELDKKLGNATKPRFAPKPMEVQDIATHGPGWERYHADLKKVPQADELYERYTGSLKHKQGKLTKTAGKYSTAGKVLIGGSLAAAGLGAYLGAKKRKKNKESK